MNIKETTAKLEKAGYEMLDSRPNSFGIMRAQSGKNFFHLYFEEQQGRKGRQLEKICVSDPKHDYYTAHNIALVLSMIFGGVETQSLTGKVARFINGEELK